MRNQDSKIRMTSCALLAWLSATSLAQTEVVTYVLDDVWLLPDLSHPREQAQPLTGYFEWTYEVGDFENGSGEFIELVTPWYNPGIDGLNITVESTSVEFSLIGNYHDYGFDLTLFLLDPLSTDSPSAIDPDNSMFEIQVGVGRRGHVISGNITPTRSDCPADLEGDGQSDLADCSLFSACMTGPQSPLAKGCEAATLDNDNDADLADFAILQATYGCP